MIAILLVAAIAIGTPASAAETTETTCTEGDLYFAGGSLAKYDSGNTEPYDQMVSAAGGADNIEVAIIPAASGTPHRAISAGEPISTPRGCQIARSTRSNWR